jgi:hypothetical protein
MGEFAGRTDFWNIGYPFAGALVNLVAPITLASIAYALHRRWRLWHTAGADVNLGPTADRWKALLSMLVVGLVAHKQFGKNNLIFSLNRRPPFCSETIQSKPETFTGMPENRLTGRGRGGLDTDSLRSRG